MKAKEAAKGVSIALGPGHHGDRIVQILKEQGMLQRVIHSWPRFKVERVSRTSGALWTEQEVPAYEWATRLSWAILCRLPRLGGAELTRWPRCLVFDRLAEDYVDDCQLFIGWAQMSLRSMVRARGLGALTLLEHPMCHVDHFSALCEREYTRFLSRRVFGYSYFPALLAERMRREYALADKICVLSSYAHRTFVRAGVPSHRLIQVPMGVDIERFSPPPVDSRPDRPVTILYVGRLELLKGVHYLLGAFARIKRRDVRLILVGPTLPEMEPMLARHESTRLCVYGATENRRLPAFYRQADLLVFPSVSDAFGLVMLEAMACGLPVIASENSGAPDVMRDGENGFVVPVCDEDAIAERMVQLIKDAELRRAMGARARERVVSAYTWRDYKERLVSAYSDLLTRPQVGGRSARAFT